MIPVFQSLAGVAQLVEHFLAKEDVASSSLVTRFLAYLRQPVVALSRPLDALICLTRSRW
jgi:hypothetical protein